MVRAAPMPGHQLHLMGVGLIERGVIENQQTGGRLDKGGNFVRQRRRVGRLWCSKRTKASWAGGWVVSGAHRAASVQVYTRWAAIKNWM